MIICALFVLNPPAWGAGGVGLARQASEFRTLLSLHIDHSKKKWKKNAQLVSVIQRRLTATVQMMEVIVAIMNFGDQRHQHNHLAL